jgi:sugar lactone lactonase YvrE
MLTRVFAVVVLVFCASAVRPAAGAHAFLAVDESRKALHYVDETDRSKDWSVAGGFRDIQLIGDHRVALSDGQGISIVDLKSRRVVATVHPAAAKGTQSFRWLPDGRILIVAGGGALRTDALGTDLGHAKRTLGARICRTTSDGGWVSGVNADLVDLAPDGTIRAKFAVPNIKHFYHVAKRDDGYYGSCGYSGVALSLNAKGEVLQRFEHPTKFFFAGLQVLANGNLVVSNWAGHGKDDVRNEQKGPQLIEFSPDGKVVWTFRDPEKLGSIHHPVILDGLDTALPHEEAGGRLVPMSPLGDAKQLAKIAQANSLDGLAALPDGAFAISVPNLNDRKLAPSIARVGKDGSCKSLAAVQPGPGSERAVPFGMDAAPDGTIYVADNQFFSGNTPRPPSRLLALSPTGEVRVVVTGLRVANGVRVHGDHVYVTETQIEVKDKTLTSALFRFPVKGDPITLDGDPLKSPHLVARFESTINRDPFGADGIVFDADGRAVVSFFDDGSIVRLSIGADGKAQKRETLVGPGLLPSGDGIAIDPATGSLYIADPRSNSIHMLHPKTGLRTLARGGALDMPVDVIFRDGEVIVSNRTTATKPCRILSLMSAD